MPWLVKRLFLLQMVLWLLLQVYIRDVLPKISLSFPTRAWGRGYVGAITTIPCHKKTLRLFAVVFLPIYRVATSTCWMLLPLPIHIIACPFKSSPNWPGITCLHVNCSCGPMTAL